MSDANLWMELARRITASERTYTEVADDHWRMFDVTKAIRFRGVAEGLTQARGLHQTLAQESRDGTLTAVQDALDGAAASVYLHANWKYLTKQMTTEQKEAFADACDRGLADGDDESIRVPRWWRDDNTGPTEGL